MPKPLSELLVLVRASSALSESIFVATNVVELESNFPIPITTENNTISADGVGVLASIIRQSERWMPDCAYLQIRVEGYIAKYQSTEPYIDAVNLVKAFYGLLLALRLIELGGSFPIPSVQSRVFVHRQVENVWQLEDVRSIEPRHLRTIERLRLLNHDALNSEQRRAVWLTDRLGKVSAVLRSGDRARSLMLGAQWLFESYCGDDELLQFVQAAVVIEILLGDKAASDLTGLGELLANRCAYLIANSHAERDQVLKDFRQIYALRSKIVQQGHSRLTLNQRTLFGQLRRICNRIIQAEVELLSKT
jgi:hypothetical protein